MPSLAPAIPTFVITLREGVEAALVVGIVLAYLNKAEQRQLNRWVYSGIAAGLVASFLIGSLFVWVFQVIDQSNQTYGPVVKPLLEAIFGIGAIALLSWMLIWMTRQSRLLKGQLEQAVGATLTAKMAAGWGVFGLIFFAVLREGFETAVFISATAQQGWIPFLGAMAGIFVAVIIGILLFRLGVKINLRQFFRVMGILLLLIVAGLVVSALAHLDVAFSRWEALNPAIEICQTGFSSCILGKELWDFRQILPEKQFPGIVLHTLLGYEDQLFFIQAISYGLFLLIVGGAYWRSLSDRHLSKE
jgi:high-affinity iron transporter